MTKYIKIIETKGLYDVISDILNQNVITNGGNIIKLLKVKQTLKPHLDIMNETFQCLYKDITKDIIPEERTIEHLRQTEDRLIENTSDFKLIEIDMLDQKQLEGINSRCINILFELGLWEIIIDE